MEKIWLKHYPKGVPAEIVEQAAIDGAGFIARQRFVVLPLLRNIILVAGLLQAVRFFQEMTMVFVLTQGGPVNASETLATYMYRFGFVRFQLGYGSAVSIYMFLICVIFSLVYQRLTRRPDYLTGL